MDDPGVSDDGDICGAASKLRPERMLRRRELVFIDLFDVIFYLPQSFFFNFELFYNRFIKRACETHVSYV